MRYLYAEDGIVNFGTFITFSFMEENSKIFQVALIYWTLA